MVNISESIWSTYLKGGNTLGDRVKRMHPTIVPMTQLESFFATWKERLDDAKAKNNDNQIEQSSGVLSFLGSHAGEEIVMLLWSAPPTSAIYATISNEIFVIIE